MRVREEARWVSEMLLRTASVVLLLLAAILMIVVGIVAIGWAAIWFLERYTGS